METKITYHILPSQVIVTLEDRTYTISKDDKRYKTLCDLIKQNAVEILPMVVEVNSPYFKVLKVLNDSQS